MKTTVDRAKLDSKAVAIIKRSGGRNSQVGQQGGSIRGNKHISFKTLTSRFRIIPWHNSLEFGFMFSTAPQGVVKRFSEQ